MNLQRRINRLNAQFGERFGFTPRNEPKYKWLWTPDTFYWLQSDDDFVTLPSGLVVPSPVYKRHSWAELHGPCYMLAVWKPPVSEREWTDRYGYTVPWPSHGEYQLIENVKLAPGEEPGEDTTLQAIWAIERDLQKTVQDHIDEGEAIVRQQHKDTLSAIHDEIDDTVPIYHPGKRGQSRLIFTEEVKRIQ